MTIFPGTTEAQAQGGSEEESHPHDQGRRLLRGGNREYKPDLEGDTKIKDVQKPGWVAECYLIDYGVYVDRQPTLFNKSVTKLSVSRGQMGEHPIGWTEIPIWPN